jgi:hypothetical protein
VDGTVAQIFRIFLLPSFESFTSSDFWKLAALIKRAIISWQRLNNLFVQSFNFQMEILTWNMSKYVGAFVLRCSSSTFAYCTYNITQLQFVIQRFSYQDTV